MSIETVGGSFLILGCEDAMEETMLEDEEGKI